MAQKTWRDIAGPIIARVIQEVGREDKAKLKAALREAYPFGERRYLPYKVWCHEIRIQLGLKKRGAGEPQPNPEQGVLFNG